MAVAIQTLYDATVNAISSACTNISNYNSIPSVFKSGYTRTFNHNRSKLVYRIQNPISQSYSSTVQDQLRECLSSYGFTDLSRTVSESTLTSIYAIIAAFTSARVKIISSQFSSTKYMYYDADSVTYNLESATVLTADSNEILASEGLSSSYSIQRIIQQTAKSYNIRYSVSISGYSFNNSYHPTNVTTPAVVYS